MNLKDYLGETNLYDKKEKLELNKPKSWLKSVSAFANGRGGKLIFGVKEDNEVLGIDDYRLYQSNGRYETRFKLRISHIFGLEATRSGFH